MSEETTNEATLNDERATRLARRQAIIDAGGNPYPEHCDVTDHVADLAARYAELGEDDADEQTHTVAGRIRAKRGQGKVAFVVLQDATDKMQLFCRINALGEEVFAAMKDLDVGDWIGVHGTMMRTKRGQLSVSVLHSADRWFGMTYHEDRQAVAQELARLHENGTYPATLRN